MKTLWILLGAFMAIGLFALFGACSSTNKTKYGNLRAFYYSPGYSDMTGFHDFLELADSMRGELISTTEEK